MDARSLAKQRRVSRNELYTLVWQTPMNRLGTEFGISGNGLAKICDRLQIPYPPRGYWAKKQAGKPVVAFKLPSRKGDVPEWVDIQPTVPKPQPLPKVLATTEAARAAVPEIAVPNDNHHLHPKVRSWLADHKREQKEREQEHKRRRRDVWDWVRPLLDDLTERDLYRFRVTSAIFTAVEKAGGKIQDSPITGKVTFLVGGRKVECSIVEKMVKPLSRPEGDAAKWTAYPGHHQTGLQSSGFLRVTITTYLDGRPNQWIETAKNKIGDWIPDITGAIIGAGEILAQKEREHLEWERRRREEEERRWEAQRLKEIDDRRWTRFRERAENWDEHARLTSFIVELERRLETEGNIEIEGRSVHEWIEWARTKADELNPFRGGLTSFFTTVTR